MKIILFKILYAFALLMNVTGISVACPAVSVSSLSSCPTSPCTGTNTCQPATTTAAPVVCPSGQSCQTTSNPCVFGSRCWSSIVDYCVNATQGCVPSPAQPTFSVCEGTTPGQNSAGGAGQRVRFCSFTGSACTSFTFFTSPQEVSGITALSSFAACCTSANLNVPWNQIIYQAFPTNEFLCIGAVSANPFKVCTSPARNYCVRFPETCAGSTEAMSTTAPTTPASVYQAGSFWDCCSLLTGVDRTKLGTVSISSTTIDRCSD